MISAALPHSDDAERAVLGAVLIENARLSDLTLVPGDFYRPKHSAIYRALTLLHGSHVPLDPVTVSHMLEATGELDLAGGIAGISSLLDGVPRAANIQAHAAIVAETARRRRIIAAGERLLATAGNGISAADLDAALRELPEAHEQRLALTQLDRSPMVEENAGGTNWLVEGLIPRGELTLLNATWKTAKTLVTYAMVLDLLAGRPVWGQYACAPSNIVVWQFEMPPREDLRRLRRLTLGAGYTPETVASDPRLAWYSRPDLDLNTTADLARFHRACAGADLVIVDSMMAAFSAGSSEDWEIKNSAIRRLLTRSFLPLTSRGCAVLVLHHYRKPQGGRDDPKGAVLGGQQFAAAAGRVYGLERLVAKRSDTRGSMRLRLALLGSWAPGEDQDVYLAVEDTPDGKGTTVRVLDSEAQMAEGGLTKLQQAAGNITNRVKRLGKVLRADALVACQGDLGLGSMTAKRGLAYALASGWVAMETSGKVKHLVLGDGTAGPVLFEDD